MKESIIIHNFGPLKRIEIEEVKQFTLFIGESASGKSTLLKLLALFRYMYKMLVIRSFLKHSSISKSPFRFTLDAYLKNSGFSEMIGSDTLVQYTVSHQGKSRTIQLKNRKLSGLTEVLDKELLAYFKVSFISEMRSLIPAWADRGARLAGAYLGFYFHETFNDFHDAAEELRSADLDYLDLEFSLKKVSNKTEYFITPKDKSYSPVRFKHASSGIQTSIPVSLITQYFSQNFNFNDNLKKSISRYLFDNDKIQDYRPVMKLEALPNFAFIHIEEPEISLFPDAQCKLITNIVRSSMVESLTERTVGLCLATHSPYVLNHLNVLIAAAQNNKLHEGAALPSEKISCYRLIDGTNTNLLALDPVSGNHLINTIDLSETMNSIYNNILSLNKNGN